MDTGTRKRPRTNNGNSLVPNFSNLTMRNNNTKNNRTKRARRNNDVSLIPNFSNLALRNQNEILNTKNNMKNNTKNNMKNNTKNITKDNIKINPIKQTRKTDTDLFKIIVETCRKSREPIYPYTCNFLISQSHFITPKMITDNPTYEWDWEALSSNPNITETFVEKNINKHWDWYELAEHPNITWDFIKYYKQHGNTRFSLKHAMYKYSSNPNIDFNIVKAQTNAQLDMDALSANPKITWDDVKNNPKLGWNYRTLSANQNITWNIIKENKTYWNYNSTDNEESNSRENVEYIIEWDYKHYLLYNPNCTWTDFKDMLKTLKKIRGSIHRFLHEYIHEILKQPYITLTIVKKNPKLFPANKLHYLSWNPNITWNDVVNNPDIRWNYLPLSQNQHITWDIIEANPTKPWDYIFIAHNPNITWDIIEANPTKPWYYLIYSSNPNITWDIVSQHPEYDWAITALLKNKMGKRESSIKNMKRAKIRSNTIRQNLIAAAWHPTRVQGWINAGVDHIVMNNERWVNKQ